MWPGTYTGCNESGVNASAGVWDVEYEDTDSYQVALHDGSDILVVECAAPAYEMVFEEIIRENMVVRLDSCETENIASDGTLR